MDINLFLKSYTATMMRIVKQYEETETKSIVGMIESGNHMQLSDVMPRIEKLAEARMILNAYPGCDLCFEPNCTSDHK